jgi:predicted nuclease of predicted toxin-antitoxin system
MAANRSKSKRRSAASSLSQPPELPPFFVDRSLGKVQVAERLRGAGLTVHVHDDHFPIDAKDVDWLPEVGRRGWAVLTKDKAIRKRALELQALRQGGVAAFILTSGDLQGSEMGQVFVDALPKMLRLLRKQEPPFVATVSRGGLVSLMEDA